MPPIVTLEVTPSSESGEAADGGQAAAEAQTVGPVSPSVLPKISDVRECSSPLTPQHRTSEADPLGFPPGQFTPAIQMGENAGVPFATPKQAARTSKKQPVHAYPAINASKSVRTASHTDGRGLSPSASESEGDNSFTEPPQRRQRKDMFGAFDPAAQMSSFADPFNSMPLLTASQAQMGAPGCEEMPIDDLRAPNITRPTSAPTNSSLGTAGPPAARASTTPLFSRNNAVSSCVVSTMTEVATQGPSEPFSQPHIRRPFAPRGRPITINLDPHQSGRSKQVFDRYLAQPSIFANSRQGLGPPGSCFPRLPPISQSREGSQGLPIQGSSASEPSHLQHSGGGGGRISTLDTSAGGMARSERLGQRHGGTRTPSPPISGPSHMQTIPESTSRTCSPEPSNEENHFLDTIEMDDFDSQDEDDESGPTPAIASLAQVPHTPTHSADGPTRAQKGKAPMCTAHPGPLGEAGRPPASVNEEVERVGHRIQAELVELAETLGLSYRTLIRKIGLGSQQEVRMPNLANMFRKVHKHRLLANKERK